MIAGFFCLPAPNARDELTFKLEASRLRKAFVMLEFDDIQHILLTRAPALTGRYEFLSFRSASGGRAWLTAILKTVQSAADVLDSVDEDKRWVTVAFTWNGLKALGVDETSLATFPEEFKQGMAARAEILGDTGANHPDNWVGGLASPDLHAIAILFARDEAERERCITGAPKARRGVRRRRGALVPGPSSDPAIRYRARPLRLPRPALAAGHRRLWRRTDARLRGAAQAGRIHPWLSRRKRTARRPAAARNLVSQRQLHGLSPAGGACRTGFATSCASTARPRRSRNSSPRSSWAAGAAARRLCWRPTRTILRLGADLQRNNDFNYKETDPHGYAVPLGSHMRRMNPRDTAANMNRRRMIRRGATYGPPLPEDAPEDGTERGIAAFVICASLIRQFEFAQNVWAKRPKLSRARQRARPDHRHSGRHARIQNP